MNCEKRETINEKLEIINGKPSVHLSVVIPAYNEERRLGPTLDKAHRYLSSRDYTFEILVVDDGSTDATIGIAEDFASRAGGMRILLNGANRGKGYSVRHGVMEAKGRYILFSDADLSTPIEDIEKLFPMILHERYDVVIGSRALLDSDVRLHQPWYREGMGKIFNRIVRLFALRGFKDTQCGFKLFTAAAARDIFSRQKIERFSFDVEALYLAKKFGYRIAEVPVTWYNSPSSRVKILGDPLRMFLDVMKIRCYDARGYYD